VLGDRPDRLENDLRRQLAGDVTELGMIAFHLPPGAGRGRIGAGQVASLQHDLADLLPIAADIAARIDDLRATGAIPSSFEDLVRDVREWIAAPEPAAAPPCARGAWPLPARIAPDGSLLASGIALRLDRLIEVLAHAGRQAQFLPQDAPPAPAPALPGDHGVAALAGLAMASAILLYCAVWILLAWPNGATMAAFAAIITGSFAAQDDPAPAIDRYLVATLKTYPLSAFILFVVLPRRRIRHADAGNRAALAVDGLYPGRPAPQPASPADVFLLHRRSTCNRALPTTLPCSPTPPAHSLPVS
jgi:hypothetical protein